MYFVAKENKTLKNVMKKYQTAEIVAGNGEDASKMRIMGRRGIDVQVEAPVGVKIIGGTGKVLGKRYEAIGIHF